MALVREAPARLGYPARETVSGAGHDAVYFARHAPTAMIFTPMQGHAVAQARCQEEAEAGAQVLFDAVVARANREGSVGKAGEERR